MQRRHGCLDEIRCRCALLLLLGTVSHADATETTTAILTTTRVLDLEQQDGSICFVTVGSTVDVVAVSEHFVKLQIVKQGGDRKDADFCHRGRSGTR